MLMELEFISPSATMRTALRLSILLSVGCNSTFHGYVNPLKHYDPATGSVFAFNLTDGEDINDLSVAIEDFLSRKDEIRQTVATLSRWRVGHQRCDTSLDTQNVWPHVQRLREAGFATEGRYVNVGGNDGRSDDPLFEYAQTLKAVGVAIERDPVLCERHRANLPQVNVVCEEVTPQNIVGLVSQGMALPASIDVLKIDIDSYDCPVLEELLPVLKAKIVLMEVNPSIPPPYQWAMLHHPKLWPFFNGHANPREVPIRGCSLAYEVDLLRRYDYDFLAFGGHDALFAHRSVRDAWHPLKPPMDEFDCYNEAFIAANGIPIERTRHWYFDINDTQAALPEIWDFFVGWMQSNEAPSIFPFALRGW